jgi:hypothetical protein
VARLSEAIYVAGSPAADRPTTPWRHTRPTASSRDDALRVQRAAGHTVPMAEFLAPDNLERILAAVEPTNVGA